MSGGCLYEGMGGNRLYECLLENTDGNSGDWKNFGNRGNRRSRLTSLSTRLSPLVGESKVRYLSTQADFVVHCLVVVN
jgi:hypothetical protein